MRPEISRCPDYPQHVLTLYPATFGEGFHRRGPGGSPRGRQCDNSTEAESQMVSIGRERAVLEFLHFRSKGTKAASGPAVVPVVMARSREFLFPRPLGGEGGEPPALSSAGARRGPHVLLVVGVRGSTTVTTAETMNNVRPYRTTRSLARRGAAIQKAHELRRTPTDAEQAAWCHSSRTASSRRLRNHLCRNILDVVWSLPEAFG